jgi:hypothetical protein
LSPVFQSTLTSSSSSSSGSDKVSGANDDDLSSSSDCDWALLSQRPSRTRYPNKKFQYE